MTIHGDQDIPHSLPVRDDPKAPLVDTRSAKPTVNSTDTVDGHHLHKENPSSDTYKTISSIADSSFKQIGGFFQKVEQGFGKTFEFMAKYSGIDTLSKFVFTTGYKAVFGQTLAEMQKEANEKVKDPPKIAAFKKLPENKQLNDFYLANRLMQAELFKDLSSANQATVYGKSMYQRELYPHLTEENKTKFSQAPPLNEQLPSTQEVREAQEAGPPPSYEAPPLNEQLPSTQEVREAGWAPPPPSYEAPLPPPPSYGTTLKRGAEESLNEIEAHIKSDTTKIKGGTAPTQYDEKIDGPKLYRLIAIREGFKNTDKKLFQKSERLIEAYCANRQAPGLPKGTPSMDMRIALQTMSRLFNESEKHRAQLMAITEKVTSSPSEVTQKDIELLYFIERRYTSAGEDYNNEPLKGLGWEAGKLLSELFPEPPQEPRKPQV